MKKVFALILSLCLAVGGILLLVEANTPALAADNGTVTVTVKPVNKLVLTIGTPSIDFGSDLWVDDVATTATTVDLDIISSKTWNLTYAAASSDDTAFPVSSLAYGTAADGSSAVAFAATGTALSGQTKTTKTGVTWSYYYTVTVPTTAVPDVTYTTSIVYTVTQ